MNGKESVECSKCGSDTRYLNTVFEGMRPVKDNYFCDKCGNVETVPFKKN